MEFIQKITEEYNKGTLRPDLFEMLKDFYAGYFQTLEKNAIDFRKSKEILNCYIDEVIKQSQNPFQFEGYHQRIPDYTSFGIEFIRPLVLKGGSKIMGKENLEKMLSQIREGENVILLANHQTEADPQIINLLLEDHCSQQAEEMIFVAGDRVTTDPLSIPFSLGCNLICIYSKKHIDSPLELKREKLQHNQKAMRRMSELLTEGGKWIYVAPSGGRDRPDSAGELSVAPFDPQSVEMMYLMAKHSGTNTHFYTLALATYAVLPPPNQVEKKIGEKRITECSPAHLAFGEEIDMENFPKCEETNKKVRRSLRSEHIWKQTCKDYLLL